MHIKLITYMRSSEIVNDGLKIAIKCIKSIDPKADCIIFTNTPRDFGDISNVPANNIVIPGTKYIRLMHLIDRETEDCLYVSLDNDMTLSENAFTAFLQKAVSLHVDFAWGRIQAQANKHFISRMVAVDKLLSHNTIRPLLWHFGVGLSIPGQCFLIRPATFKRKLYQMDTFLDDLALGAYINEHFEELHVLISPQVIGYEYPNECCQGLCRQRKRWAKGFYQVLKASKGKKYYSKVLLHGAIYHLNWIVNWVFIGSDE